MSFTTAVKTAFSRYVDFEGRSGRPEYWWFVLFLFIGSIVAGFTDAALFGTSMDSIGLFGAVFALGTLIPAVSVSVRRLHDIDRSGWWLLLTFVPIIGWGVLLYWACCAGTTQASS